MKEVINTYEHKETSDQVSMKRLGMGQVKITHADGKSESVSVGYLNKHYKFVGSSDPTVAKIAKGQRTKVFGAKRKKNK